MKIAFICRKYHKHGGISKYVSELAERACVENEVHIFANSFENLKPSMKCHKVPMLKSKLLFNMKKHAINNLLEVFSFTIFSTLMVNSTEYDIVHNNGDYFGDYDIYTVPSCHKAWLKIARASEGLAGKVVKSFLNPLHFIILLGEKVIFARKRRIIAISEVIKKEVLENYPVNPLDIDVIHLGCTVEKSDEKLKQKSRMLIENKYNLNNESILLLFAGYEFGRKGLAEIIKSLSKIKNENLYLLVAGQDDPGKYRQLSEKLEVNDKVIFLGHIADMPVYYNACDVFVFPTKYEPFGLVITEAMSYGLPVITTEIAGASELIENGVDGELISKPENNDELTACITKIICDKNYRKELSKNAMVKASLNTWDEVYSKTYKVYEEEAVRKKARV